MDILSKAWIRFGNLIFCEELDEFIVSKVESLFLLEGVNGALKGIPIKVKQEHYHWVIKEELLHLQFMQYALPLLVNLRIKKVKHIDVTVSPLHPSLEGLSLIV